MKTKLWWKLKTLMYNTQAINMHNKALQRESATYSTFYCLGELRPAGLVKKTLRELFRFHDFWSFYFVHCALKSLFDLVCSFKAKHQTIKLNCVLKRHLYIKGLSSSRDFKSHKTKTFWCEWLIKNVIRF